MVTVLMVDDEQLILLAMERFFVREGFNIHTATEGREALAIGSRIRPEVLVVDWFLKNAMSGPDIARALRLMHPHLRTILITGYPTRALEAEAAKVAAFAVLEKPCMPMDITTVVRQALAAEPPPPPHHTAAVFELDATGNILFANSQAQALMHAIAAGTHPTHFAACFAPGTCLDMDQAATEWIDVVSQTTPPTTWHLRSQPLHLTGSRLVVATPHHLPLPETTAYLVGVLLDIPEDNQRPQTQ